MFTFAHCQHAIAHPHGQRHLPLLILSKAASREIRSAALDRRHEPGTSASSSYIAMLGGDDIVVSPNDEAVL
jgi:hypothetical protein